VAILVDPYKDCHRFPPPTGKELKETESKDGKWIDLLFLNDGGSWQYVGTRPSHTCSLCEGLGELYGYAGCGRVVCHECDGTGKENKTT